MNHPEILIVDDEVEVGTFFQFYFQEEKNLPVRVAYSGAEARQLITRYRFDLALVDLKLPDADGIILLKEIKNRNPRCEVIIMTGYSTIKSAVEAIKYGAFDYIDKPFEDLNQLDNILDHVFQSLRGKQSYLDKELDSIALNFGIVMSEASPLQEILALGKKIAGKKVAVLIEGETGTGKELLARFLHASSHRANHPFIAVNCGALTENLLESELFGHEKGAFTGADHKRKGIFEIAHNSSLFLDEINNASPAIQLKLLRVLETGEFYRVGGETPIKTDVRIIAASNKNLRQAVQDGYFREDLLYRLDVVNLTLPPLRERKMDLPCLIRYFIDKSLPEKAEKGSVMLSPEASAYLYHYSWPGNIRELSNVITRALALSEGKVISPSCLPSHILHGQIPPESGSLSLPISPDEEISWQQWTNHQLTAILERETIDLPAIEAVWEREKYRLFQALIQHALIQTDGNQAKAAKMLHIPPRTLRYWKNEKRK